MNLSLLYIFLLKPCLLYSIKVNIRQNIVLVVVDDLGWNDVAFTKKVALNSGPDVPETPHMDALASDGVTLDNLYTQAFCSPSRASLFTGRYPFRLGSLLAKFILPTNIETGALKGPFMSEVLNERGYQVHGVGKWHLGHNNESLPTSRGFQSFYGLYHGMGTYFSHRYVSNSWRESDESWTFDEEFDDLHYDYKVPGGKVKLTNVHDEAQNVHKTSLFTDKAVKIIDNHDDANPLFLYVSYTAPHSPLEPEEVYVQSRNLHIKDDLRRKYAAMVTQIDDGIGEIVDALEKKNLLQNTVIVFISDNGAAQIRNCWDFVGGSNYPYRDGKATYFEGGIKSPAFIWAPWMSASVKMTNSRALAHIVDLHYLILKLSLDIGTETLTDMFSVENTDKSSLIDYGYDGGPYILNVLNGNNTGRSTILHNLVVDNKEDNFFCSVTQPVPGHYFVIRHKHYKLMYGRLADWCASDTVQEPCLDPVPWNIDGPVPQSLPTANSDVAILFNIEADPFETTNIARDHPDIVRELRILVEENYMQYAPTELIVGMEL